MRKKYFQGKKVGTFLGMILITTMLKFVFLSFICMLSPFAVLTFGVVLWNEQELCDMCYAWPRACLTTSFITTYWVHGAFLYTNPFGYGRIQTTTRTTPRETKTHLAERSETGNTTDARAYQQNKLKKILLLNLLQNQLIAVFACVLFCDTAFDVRPSRVPGTIETLLHFSVFILCNEVVFYVTHKLLHTKYLFRTVHYIHHQYSAPHAFSAIYCHWFEFVASNLASVMIGCVCMHSSVWTVALWIVTAIITTQTHHSGLRLPWMRGSSQPEFHDNHHRTPNINFGSGLFMDYAFSHRR